MTFEEMTFERLKMSPALQTMLARYENRPAVFYQKAAADTDVKWGAKKFPRIDYLVDIQEDPAHNTNGVLSINIWCDSAGTIEPESVEQAVRNLLHATFVQPENSPVYSIVWTRSENFEADLQNDKTKPIVGYTMLFTITALPPQVTTNPDPISAINAWTKAAIPNATVIGLDAINGWFVPDETHPAIYWQLSALTIPKVTNTVVWYGGQLTGHIFGQSTMIRMPAVWKLMQDMAIAGHIIMSDGSPMQLSNIVENTNANYLIEGQIVVNILYGSLRPLKSAEPLRNITISPKR